MMAKVIAQKKAADATAYTAANPDPNAPNQASAEAKAGEFAKKHPGRVRKNEPKIRRSGGRAAPAPKASRGLG